MFSAATKVALSFGSWLFTKASVLSSSADLRPILSSISCHSVNKKPKSSILKNTDQKFVIISKINVIKLKGILHDSKIKSIKRGN